MKAVLSIAGCCLVYAASLAQISDYSNAYYPPSPNAMSLMKFANTPVNLYTGVPDINIPLLTLPSRKLNIPVSLSYHASGIKVQDIAGPVGLGWALNAGGVITRVVRGVPDEVFPCDGLSLDPAGNFLCDPEPDMFYFRVPGSGGKFVKGSPGSIAYTIPYRPIAIKTLDLTNFSSWVITDENGVNYFFGSTGASREISRIQTMKWTGYDPATEFSYTSSWYLDRIETPDGLDIITFEYENGDAIEYEYFSEKLEIVEEDCDGSPFHHNISGTNQKIFIDEPLYLANVSSMKGSIEISYSQVRNDIINGKGISTIELKDLDDNRIRRIQFTQTQINSANSYFPNPGNADKLGPCTSPDCWRFLLEKVEDLTISSSPILISSFEYDPTLLPPRNTTLSDHWGYSIAHPDIATQQLTTLEWTYRRLPTTDIFGYQVKGVNKDPYFEATKAQTLTKINYGTGSFTEFEFEPNMLQSGETTGGLRVSKVTSGTGSQSTHVDYDYEEGHAYMKPIYHYALYNSKIISEILYPVESSCNVNFGVLRSDSFNSIFDGNGDNVGYGKVTITYPNGGYEVNYFTGFQDRPDQNPIVAKIIEGQVELAFVNGPPFSPYTSKSWERGLLKLKETFNIDGQRLASVESTYDFDQPNKLVLEGNAWERSNNHATFQGTYNIYSRPIILTSQTERYLNPVDSANFISRTTQYQYDAVYYLPSQITQPAGARNLITQFIYPFHQDYDLNQTEMNACYDQQSACELDCSEDCIAGSQTPGCLNCLAACQQQLQTCTDGIPPLPTEAAAIMKMRLNHMITPLIEKSTWLDKGNGPKLLDINVNTFQLVGAENDIVAPYQSWTLNDGRNQAGFVSSHLDASDMFIKNPDMRLTGIVAQYDEYGNPMLIIDASGMATSFDYDASGLYLTGKTMNPGSHELTATYETQPLVGLLQENDANGRSLSYEYDCLNRLVRIRDSEGNILQHYEYGLMNGAGDCSLVEEEEPAPDPGSSGGTDPDWQATGQTRCYEPPWGIISGELEEEVKDMNSESAYYGQKFWVLTTTVGNCIPNSLCYHKDEIEDLSGQNCMFGTGVQEPAPPGLCAIIYHFPNNVSTNLIYFLGDCN